MSNIICAPILAVRETTLKFKQSLRSNIDRKIDNVLASFFRWALSKRAVQLEVVRTFEGVTPMCCLLEKVVGEAVDGRQLSIDASDVEGLDRYIEGAVEEVMRDNEIHAENIKGLDDAIEAAFEFSAEKLVDAVISEMRDRLRN
jgi:hypothetical protein